MIRGLYDHFQEQTAPDIAFENVIHSARENGVDLDETK